MILIGDSGSSKTDWILVDDHLKIAGSYVTEGLNPNFTPAEIITSVISGSRFGEEYHNKVKKIFFYGSGCGSLQNADMMKNILSSIFKHAEVEVKSDLFGAAYATSGLKAGVVCILGTGSNSCFYDGTQLHSAGYNLGYLLGDEGSGFYFGKRLLRDYFYGILPKELKEKFAAKYSLTREELLQSLYHKKFPNRFVALFAPFIHENISHSYCRYLVDFGFDEFLKIFVTSIPNYKLWPAHFVGSVAFHFSDILMENCKKNNIVVGKIIQAPIHELAAYHIKLESRS